MSSKAVILVGGDTRGTRFRPISLSVPKVLFPAAGKPLLAHAVDAVVSQKAADVQEILLIGFYENSVFDNFIAEVNHRYPDVNIRYLREYRAMGTAGGLYHFRDQILRGKPQNVFVINADICSSFPLADIKQTLVDNNARAVIMGTRVPKGISPMFGSIISDDHGKVLHYVEKPEESVSTLINGGIYLLDVSVFDYIAKAKETHEARAGAALSEEEDDSEKLQLEQDVLPLIADEGRLYQYTTTSFWRQVKEAGSALIANRLYLDELQARDPSALASGANIKGPVVIDPKARVDPTAIVGPNVEVGPGAKIGPGARVRDAVLLDRAEVRENAVVLNAILAPGARVGRWARIEGSPTAVNDYDTYAIKDGIKVPRTAILATDVFVADEVHLQNSIVLPHKDIKTDVKNEIVM